jgi:hypothetical protein
MVSVVSLTSCGTGHLFGVTETPYPTNTLTSTNTQIPSKTCTPSPTEPTILVLDRPVSINIPLYHIYGYIVNGAANYNGFHNGYDYGRLNCDEIAEPVLATGAGTVFYPSVDSYLRPGQKNGGLYIDHGIHIIADGSVVRVVSRYDHIVPVVSEGDQVETGTIVGNFSTCARYGYDPELHLTIYALDFDVAKYFNIGELRGYIVDSLMQISNWM